MTVENDGEQPANDAAVIDPNDVTKIEAPDTEDAEPALDDDGNPVEKPAQEPEWAEIEIDGKKYRVEAAAKDGYLRQADYTKKTQEIADKARALDADREGFVKQTEAQKAHFKAATQLAGLDEQLEPYVKYSPQDWMNLHATDPQAYEQHRINYDFLKNKRDAVARDFSQKEQERIEGANRESGNRVQKVQAEIARLIPEWTPGGELDIKLSKYGIGLGFSPQDLAETTLRNPQFVHQLKRLHDFDEAAKKTKLTQTFQASQEAKPVTRVGGNGGAAARRTTDSSGDALSTEEWSKREDERVAKLRKA